jgi:C-terminal processing protease CtpA/Prc
MQGSALAALALLGMLTFATAGEDPGKSAPTTVVATHAQPNVSARELTKFIKTLKPDVQSLMRHNSHTEQVKIYLKAREIIDDTTGSDDFKKSLEGKSAAEKDKAEAKLRSSAVVYASDAKYNYCHVMLAGVARMAYDEKGLKKLVSANLKCPIEKPKDVAKTIADVNQKLACLFDDPAYTRVMPAEEATDFRKAVDGTKAAFDGGGIGMVLLGDPTQTIPLTAKEQAQFEAARVKYLAHPKTTGGVDECTGKRIPLTVKEKAAIAASWNEGPSKTLAFAGIIEHVMKGSPAEKAGIVDGDVIVKVDGTPVNELPFGTVVSKMLRGPVGSTVKVTLKRDETKEYAITREVILPDNVWSRDLGDGVYSIIVTNFERNKTAFAMLDEMQKIGDKARAFAFDFRNNGGGLLTEGVEAVSWLIHDGVIVSERVRVPGDPAHPKYNKITWKRVGSQVISETVDDNTHQMLSREVIEFSENDDVTGEPHRQFKDHIPFLGGKPMAVIINGMCASACEIFAGGVGENFIPDASNSQPSADSKNAPQGAKLIGSQSFGKFIGQRLAQGPFGTALKATIFRYYTPTGKWLGDAEKTRIGLTPDIIVPQPKNAVPYTKTDAQLNATKAYLLNVLNGLKAKVQSH